MTKKLNHSRYLDYGAKSIGENAYEYEKHRPTHKQINFYRKLYAICKKNKIDTNTGTYTKTRMDYAMAIDKLLERLNENGIDIKGNGKKAEYVLKVNSDKDIDVKVNEYIEVED